MGRDLTAFLSQKPEIGSSLPPDEDEDEYEPADDANPEFMNSFFDEVRIVRETIAKITAQVEEVEVKHEALLVAYNQEQTTEAKVALEATMGRITALANKVRTILKRMGQTNKEMIEASKLKGEGMHADVRIQEAHHASLIQSFSRVMNRYNDIQAQHKLKYRNAIARQCRIVDPNVSDDVIQGYIESGQSAEIFKGVKLEKAEKQLSDIKDRHEDIKRLERSLMELHEMFVDMSILVSEQGDMIDRIENQVAKSADYVESAKKKLIKAKNLQSSARRKKWCCTITVLIIIAVLVVILVTNFT